MLTVAGICLKGRPLASGNCLAGESKPNSHGMMEIYRVTTTGQPGFTCHFCERPFQNAQAVRAHLKACELYKVKVQIDLQKQREVAGEPFKNALTLDPSKRKVSQDDLMILLDVT